MSCCVDSGLQEAEEGQGTAGWLLPSRLAAVEKSQGVFQKGRSQSRVLRKEKSAHANKEFIGSYYKERQGGADLGLLEARLKDP